MTARALARSLLAVLCATVGCATATEGDDTDAAPLPADVAADRNDFDFGPDPFTDTGTPADASAPSDTAGSTDRETPIDSPFTPDTPVGVDTPVATDASGCPSGLSECSGSCVDTRLSVAHCGACGHSCGETQTCAAGVCSGGMSSCVAPRLMCGASCVDGNTDASNCGACGHACGTGSTCMAGTCTPPMTMGCTAGADDCDGNAANGCELMHAATTTACATGDNLGTYCGDQSCGTFCPSTSWHMVATRTDQRSHWFRARVNECSNCVSTLAARLTLTVPTGVDYDLFVYRPCGSRVAQSVAGAGMPDTVTMTISDGIGSDESSDYFVEVRYISGSSCASWSLSLEARSTGPSSC